MRTSSTDQSLGKHDSIVVHSVQWVLAYKMYYAVVYITCEVKQ
jgi:hypothetical protein